MMTAKASGQQTSSELPVDAPPAGRSLRSVITDGQSCSAQRDGRMCQEDERGLSCRPRGPCRQRLWAVFK